MKRNLLGGIIFIGMAILSSCSVPNQLSALKNTINDDDVYYTKAQAGDQTNYFADNNSNYRGDDDYYYYGDYTTRLNRFANYSPFDYNDDFYYSYAPYNNGFGDGLNYNLDYYGYNYGYGRRTSDSTNYIASAYSPYDFGYSPYDNYGYDDYGYGDIYAAYILGGGGGYEGYGGSHHHHKTNTTGNQIGYNPNVRGIRTTPSPGITRIAAYGKPTVNINNINGIRVTSSVNGLNTVVRQARDNNVYRPQQTQSFNNNNSSNSVSSGSSSSSSVSSGGGGRPARP